ncbi:MAG: dienelactone hydrolase family protein, partial [Deltaproteobacteria bacterium]
MLAARRTALRARASVALVTLALAGLALPACGAGGSSVATPPASSAPPAASAPSPAGGSPIASPTASPPASPGKAVTTAELARQFPASSGPLGLRITGKARWDGVPVRHLTYRSEGAVVTGTLSVPAGDGPFPAVLYAPGVGCPRDMFAADVAALQRAGIAALAIDPPDGRDPWVRPITTSPEVAAEAHVRYVADLRRGLDVLRSLPAVDSHRLGYVGYSWGGFVGGYLAGLRAPVRAYV